MADDFELLKDYEQRAVRLTDERWQHILVHPEMDGQYERIIETLSDPDFVIITIKDKTVYTYQ